MSTPTNPMTQAMPPGPTPLTTTLRDAFWHIVVECLIAFHGQSFGDAHLMMNFSRLNVENAPQDIDGELVYHQEPFYVACDIAHLNDIQKQEKLLTKNAARYESILSQFGW